MGAAVGRDPVRIKPQAFVQHVLQRLWRESGVDRQRSVAGKPLEVAPRICVVADAQSLAGLGVGSQHRGLALTPSFPATPTPQTSGPSPPIFPFDNHYRRFKNAHRRVSGTEEEIDRVALRDHRQVLWCQTRAIVRQRVAHQRAQRGRRKPICLSRVGGRTVG